MYSEICIQKYTLKKSLLFYAIIFIDLFVTKYLLEIKLDYIISQLFSFNKIILLIVYT